MAVLGALVDALERLVDEVGQRECLSGDAALGDLEDFAFGMAEHFVGRLGLFVRVVENLGAGVDQTPHHRLVADNAGVVLGVGSGGGGVPQFGEVGVTAYVFDLFLLL